MTSLDFLRASFRDESHVPRLTTSAPPVVRQVNKLEKNGRIYFEVDEGGSEPPDQNGRSLSAEMVQLIGSITAELHFYPPRFPVRRALAEWERSCRRRHRGRQWWDHSGAPVCSDMLRLIVEGGATPRYAINAAGLGQTWTHYQRGERLIQAGAAFVAERLERWQDEQLGITHDREHCAVCRAEEAG
jgi:hypothetical protein